MIINSVYYHLILNRYQIMLNHVKRTNNNRPSAPPFSVINHIICDRSGSMCTFGGVQVDMNDKLLNDAKELAITNNIKTHLTFTTFDTTAETHLDNVDIAKTDVPTKEELVDMLKPRSSTRFIDTVLEALEKIKEQKKAILDSLPRAIKMLEPNIVTILNCTTDGMDNASSSTQTMLRNAMNKYRKEGGEAILLAANMDAQEIGRQYGFSEDTSLTVHNSDPEAITFAFDCVMQTTREVSSGGRAIPYTPLQRSCSQATPVDDDNSFNGTLATVPVPPRLTRQRVNTRSPLATHIIPPLPPLNLQRQNANMILHDSNGNSFDVNDVNSESRIV